MTLMSDKKESGPHRATFTSQYPKACVNRVQIVLHDFRNMLASLIGNLEYAKPHFESHIFDSSLEALFELRTEISALFELAKARKVEKGECAEMMIGFRDRINFIKRCIHSSVCDENEEIMECLADMKHASEQCESIIAEAEAYAEATKISERPLNVELTTYLAPITEVHKKQYPDIDISLEVKGKPRATIYPTTLKRSIENLLLNSVQAVEEKEGVIQIRVEEIAITEEKSEELGIKAGTFCLIEIEDNGSGISPEMLRKIFKGNMTTKTGGSGIGLISVRNGIMIHNGHLMVESEEGEYTRVKTFLPSIVPPKNSTVVRKGTAKEDDDVCKAG